MDPPNAPTLNIDERMLETVNERIQQAKAKGAIARARLRLQQNVTQTTSPEDHIIPDEVDWVAETEAALADENLGNFEEVKKWFQSLKRPTMEQTIRYEAAKRDEESRLKRVRTREQLPQESADDELFCPQDDTTTTSVKRPHGQTETITEDNTTSATGPTTSKPSAPKRRRRQATVTAKDDRRSMELGLNSMLGKGPKRSNKSGGSRRRPKSRANDINLGTLFGSDIIRDAHANSSSLPIPGFTDANKDKALTQLIASIPSADRQEALSDKQVVIEATRKFTRRVKSDKRGGWRLPGLKTSLYHHQLLGAAFMRDRENSPTKPYGGMLCDVMGLGKTIQTLASIIDGQSFDPNEAAKTTLIVVPVHLVSHWKHQIAAHCEDELVGSVLFYYSKCRMELIDAVKSFQMFSVVITSYEEIRRSYPKNEPPPELTTDEQKTEWWADHYKKKAGPFHRMKFRRIILDEGHLIRNPESQVSIAVRALHGHFKWILSGTPLLNHIEEFWSYFDFLEVPNVGTYPTFIHNYCKGNEESAQRLVNLIRSILYRRTYEARLFSLPIVHLPDLGERTVEVEFSAAENKIYWMIIDKFLLHINSLAGGDRTDTQYRCILSMILKLRMFNSHILAAQDVVQSIFDSEAALGEIAALIDNTMPTTDPAFVIVRLIQSLVKESQNSAPNSTAQPDTTKLMAQFRSFISELKSSENEDQLLLRLSCPVCKSVPTETYVSSCMHLFCEDCLISLQESSLGNTEKGRGICPVCDVPIEDAEQCGSLEGAFLEPLPQQAEQAPSQSGMPVRKKKSRLKKRLTNSKSIFNPLTNDSGDGDEDDDSDEAPDWLAMAGHLMPSAKVTKVRDIICGWLQEAPDTKVVIFTQFRDMATIFGSMCIKEGWGYTLLLGNMSFPARDDSIRDFKEDQSIQVMIASLKAGGIGLDLTMANKCILVEPWWNEAIQQQAFCRLFRIGQARTVEIVKLVVKNTIDDYMLELQEKKTSEIDGTIGVEALSNRDTIPKLLKLFGTVSGNEKEGFIITADPDRT